MPTLVLVHIGTHFPEHINDCISQLQKITDISVHVLINKSHADKINGKVTIFPLEDIKVGEQRKKFEETSKLDSHFKNGFWKYTTMRFFYIYEHVVSHGLTVIFHIENDNLIYYDFTKFLDIALDSSFMTNANLHRTLKNFRKSNTLSRKFASFYVPLLLQWAKSTLLTTDDGEEQLDDLICRGQLNGLRRIQGIELVFLCFLDKVFSVSLHDDVSDDEFKRVDNLKKFFVSSS